MVDEIFFDRLEPDPFAGVVIPANPTESLLKLSIGREGLRYDKINSLCFSSVIDRAHEFFLGGQQDRIATIRLLFKFTEDIQYIAILIEFTDQLPLQLIGHQFTTMNKNRSVLGVVSNGFFKLIIGNMFIKCWVEIFTLVTIDDIEFHVLQNITLDFAIFVISRSCREADA